MTNRLADAVSPYLRAHAENPVDWWPWGEAAFAEATRRQVPVLVSIGYATCHWCHVMARESFSDPELAAFLNDSVVAIKVDREEYPDVDASFLAAASAFTPELGWPLTVFTTPDGLPFFAGTYFPPRPVGRVPSFRQVIEAVAEAWAQRRGEVQETGAAIADALRRREPQDGDVPDPAGFADAVARIAALEDPEFGGFGTDAKFPNAPVLAFLLARGRAGDADADALGHRTLAVIAASGLADPVEGGFFRYAVRRDWTEPHYERMLSDNAQLLDLATDVGDAELAARIAGFLLEVLRLPSGAFASGQDSESILDGERNEGGYYALGAEARADQPRPALDAKVLTGLNGLAIGALAGAGVRFERADWIEAAAVAARYVVEAHVRADRLVRASRDGIVSDAVATLEDFGGLAGGLLRLALASGEASWAAMARELVEACATEDGVGVPDGPDPVLVAHGLAVGSDSSDGAAPSGRSALADAALRLAALTGVDGHRVLAELAVAPMLIGAVQRPTAVGAALAVASRLAGPVEQLIIVTPDRAATLTAPGRAWAGSTRTFAIVTPAHAEAFAEAGFELFEGRIASAGRPTAYFCERFVCRLPVSDPGDLDALLTPAS